MWVKMNLQSNTFTIVWQWMAHRNAAEWGIHVTLVLERFIEYTELSLH